MPHDLSSLWAHCDGLELSDGTRLLGREEVAKATQWLREEKSLDWDGELFVIGERDDLVIVRDVDRAGKRAGGGVLEAPTDGLTTFRRVSWDLLGFLEVRAGVCEDPSPAPEAMARKATVARDAEGLRQALEKPFYPGGQGEAAHAALLLGEILAASGDTAGAMRAFVESVEYRARGARRGAEALERAAGFRAAARAAEAIGEMELSRACLLRANAPP